jgi:hypothetical protein
MRGENRPLSFCGCSLDICPIFTFASRTAENVLAGGPWCDPRRACRVNGRPKKGVDFPSALWYKCAMGAIHLKIDDGLRDKFKALCALKRSTMQREIINLIEKEVLKTAARKR